MSHRMIAAAFAVALVGGTSGALAAESDRKLRMASYEPRIICGQTGCFNVPPGCASELRRSGRTVVAVVMCDRRH